VLRLRYCAVCRWPFNLILEQCSWKRSQVRQCCLQEFASTVIRFDCCDRYAMNLEMRHELHVKEVRQARFPSYPQCIDLHMFINNGSRTVYGANRLTKTLRSLAHFGTAVGLSCADRNHFDASIRSHCLPLQGYSFL